MTRKEVEARLFEKMQEIMAIAKEYDPDIDYLSLTYIMREDKKLEDISINNKYWEREKKIDFYKILIKRKEVKVNE